MNVDIQVWEKGKEDETDYDGYGFCSDDKDLDSLVAYAMNCFIQRVASGDIVFTEEHYIDVVISED